MKFLLTLLLGSMVHVAMAQNLVSGTITDEETRQPIPGVTLEITALGAGTTTDQNGHFELANLSNGTYELKVRHVSFEPESREIRLTGNQINLSISLHPSTLVSDEVVVNSTRASSHTPVTYTEISDKEISKQNNGQDLPYVLNFTPSMVTTSDAGAGIGYTGLRIRGSDATRINVTINGVPLNDSESMGVFWVDIPDIASSTKNIQIQRGVGTSTNGAGSFGGTINLQTMSRNARPYAEFLGTIGSYGTARGTLNFGSGLFGDHWTVDARVSGITSDGYIDRASSDLKSYYLSTGYYGKNTLLKLIAFGGAERTYQSWYGTPEAVLEEDPEGIEEVIANNGLDDEQAENMRTAGRTFNWYLYKDQVDDYKQDHLQLQLSQAITPELNGSFALHYTYGRGYYEQFRRDDDLADYGLSDVVIDGNPVSSTDLVRRRWLDNDFYGLTYAFDYSPDKQVEMILGGAWNTYKGDHYGRVIQAEEQEAIPENYQYYFNTGDKTDFTVYGKATRQWDRFSVFADLQYRKIDYQVEGIDNDLRDLGLDQSFSFFNPKFGLSYTLSDVNTLYASYAIANREPVRTDFLDSPELPQSERLSNIEAGYRSSGRLPFQANFYLMDYKDQLVLTGELNDVGSSLRRNVPDSYRMGLELQAGVKLTGRLNWQVNTTFSRNKIKSFTEVIYDYGENFDEYHVIENEHSDTDISFSPAVIAGSQLLWQAATGLISEGDQLELGLLSKFVGKQYLDNTSNENRKLDPYFVNDVRVRYVLEGKKVERFSLTFQVNNIFSELYSSNGYTFGYQGGLDYVVRENYYYPQAPRNYLLTLGIKI